MPIWRGDRPLVLASASPARRALLVAAGIPIEVRPARIDERALEAALPPGERAPDAVAHHLARAKAEAVAAEAPGRIVLGADQTLDLDGRCLAKAPDADAAVEQLVALAGRTHALHSAACLALPDGSVQDLTDTARLTLRKLDRSALARYVALAGRAATASVGGYEIEGLGIHLFERIEGDHATILGLPLLCLLHAFRQLGLVGI